MTREEAIAILKNSEYELSNQVGSKYCQKKYEAVKMAIKALEQEPTTKNDLGVDCISRKAVIDELKRYFHNEYYQRTSIQDCRDCFIEDVLNHLPSLTPQEPILDKIRAEIEPKCDRINSLASVLSYTAHREIQELLCEIMDLCKAESEVEDGNDD